MGFFKVLKQTLNESFFWKFNVLKNIPFCHVHAVNYKCLLDSIFGNHFVESIVKFVDGLWIGFELEVVIKAILQNEGIFGSHGVIGFSGIFFNVEEILNDIDVLCPLSNHEENWTHESDLVPKKWISNKVKVVYFISII